jgi:hypothetical protein
MTLAKWLGQEEKGEPEIRRGAEARSGGVPGTPGLSGTLSLPQETKGPNGAVEGDRASTGED